eukprot:scaffold3386_cov59-Phaeocystis_antarctica.AAC.8
MITCPSSCSPCSFTGGEPARTSSRMEEVLEMLAPLAAMISSRLSVRLASSTKSPSTKCSPADSSMTTSLPGSQLYPTGRSQRDQDHGGSRPIETAVVARAAVARAAVARAAVAKAAARAGVEMAAAAMAA